MLEANGNFHSAHNLQMTTCTSLKNHYIANNDPRNINEISMFCQCYHLDIEVRYQQMWTFHIASRKLSSGHSAQSLMREILPYVSATQKNKFEKIHWQLFVL